MLKDQTWLGNVNNTQTQYSTPQECFYFGFMGSILHMYSSEHFKITMLLSMISIKYGKKQEPPLKW